MRKIGFLAPRFIKILTILEKEHVHGVGIKGWEWVAFSLGVEKKSSLDGINKVV